MSLTGTFSSGPAFGNIVFRPSPPENACRYGNLGGVFWPGEMVRYTAVDARISGTFRMPWGHDLELDFAAFNLFDPISRTCSA